MHSEFKRDIYGDLGVCKGEYEVWRTIMMFGYDHLSEDAEKRGDLLVVSLEKLLLLKALGMSEEKYFKDLAHREEDHRHPVRVRVKLP